MSNENPHPFTRALVTGSLYREHVVPLFKGPRPTGCQKPLCRTGNLCAACRGRDNRLKGLRKQATARKRLKIRGARYRTQLANEENYGDPLFRWEHKHGAQIRAVFTRYWDAETQAEAQRAIGDTRSLVVSCSLEGYEDELLVIRRSAWMRDVRPCLEGP